MTSLPRFAWTEHSLADQRPLLIVDLRLVGGATVGAVLVATPLLSVPFGRLSSPFALLIALPTLALTLEAFGLQDVLARRLAAVRAPLARLLAGYVLWLLTSAVLTLDVAAVAGSSVAIRAADEGEERRWQLGGAILGSNVGSLLLPFSNLTNLVLVSATGIGLASYVSLALWPQLAAALTVGLLLAFAAKRSIARRPLADRERTKDVARGQPKPTDRNVAWLAGGVAMIGALAAVAAGLAGGDMAVPFAVSSGIVAAVAVASGRLTIGSIIGSIPLAGLAVIVIAAIASGPMAVAGGLLPLPDDSLGGLLLAMAVGSVLAMTVNNLPAAAFGATWLSRGHPAAIIAFLIGTNIAAIATPHGSVATILARSVGMRHGIATTTRAYVGFAWPYAAGGAVAAVLALALATR